MLIIFETVTATARVLVTNPENIVKGQRRFEVSGTATDEVAARTLAEEIKQILTRGRETHWRVSFEYKPLSVGWHLYARFSVRQNAAASDPSPPNIDPSPEPFA